MGLGVSLSPTSAKSPAVELGGTPIVWVGRSSQTCPDEQGTWLIAEVLLGPGLSIPSGAFCLLLSHISVNLRAPGAQPSSEQRSQKMQDCL